MASLSMSMKIDNRWRSISIVTNQYQLNDCYWYSMKRELYQLPLISNDNPMTIDGIDNLILTVNWLQISSCFKICKLLGMAALYCIFETMSVNMLTQCRSICLSWVHMFVHCYFIEAGRLLTLPVTTIGWHLVDISFDTGPSLRWRLNHKHYH